jgi:hypothetical protein
VHFVVADHVQRFAYLDQAAGGRKVPVAGCGRTVKQEESLTLQDEVH